jgi:hypothetical protein
MCRDRRSVLAEHQPFKLTDTKGCHAGSVAVLDTRLHGWRSAPKVTGSQDSQLTITSPAFANSAPIAARYTCQGADISPELQWTGAPPDTRSFSLIVDDPDARDPRAPKMTWVHWVI